MRNQAKLQILLRGNFNLCLSKKFSYLCILVNWSSYSVEIRGPSNVDSVKLSHASEFNFSVSFFFLFVG